MKIQLTDFSELLQVASTTEEFSTVLADPPWRFTNRTGKVAPEHGRLKRYETMSLDEIKGLPVSQLVAKNAHLYLWVPNALLKEGIDVLEAWGFRYVSNIIWAKRRKDGGPDGRGVGFYFRNVTEVLLFGVKGSLRTLAPARSQVNMLETRKREHSRKPDEQYDLIENCSPGPYVELFARHARENWTVWGNEASDEIEPEGKTHPMYKGGPMVPRYQRLSKNELESLADEVTRLYLETGKSIREISTLMDLSIGRVRSLLREGGVEFRPRGAAPKGE